MRTLFSPFGRSGRLAFWVVAVLIWPIVGTVIYYAPIFVPYALSESGPDPMSGLVQTFKTMLGALGLKNALLLSGVWMFVSFYPIANVSIRRLHDFGRSGWWVLLPVIPVAIYFLLPFFVLVLLENSQRFDSVGTYHFIVGAVAVASVAGCALFLGTAKSVKGPNKFGA